MDSSSRRSVSIDGVFDGGEKSLEAIGELDEDSSDANLRLTLVCPPAATNAARPRTAFVGHKSSAVRVARNESLVLPPWISLGRQPVLRWSVHWRDPLLCMAVLSKLMRRYYAHRARDDLQGWQVCLQDSPKQVGDSLWGSLKQV